MTAPPTALCGHRWERWNRWMIRRCLMHRCIEPADHPPYPTGHRCRCGKTTWRWKNL